MFKKIVFIALVSVSFGLHAFAQDASKPAEKPKPKASFTLTQKIGSETNNGLIAKSNIVGACGNAEYSATAFKVQVEFDLGNGIKLAPWVQDSFEAKLDPGTAVPYASDAFRNRLYTGVNTTFAFSKAFNLSLNLEYRNAVTITSTSSAPTSSTLLPEHRFTPFITFSGKADALYYSLATDFPMYIDAAADGLDSTTFELEGRYNAGYAFTLDSTSSIKFEMNYYFDILNIAYSASPASTHAVASEMRPKIILSAGDIAPFIGCIKSTKLNAGDVTTNDILGATIGADVKIGTTATFNITADIGVDLYKVNQPWVTGVAASIVIKG